MRLCGTAFALLSLGLILGCTQTPVTTAVLAAPKTPAPQQIAHNFKLYGSLEKGEFLVDVPTGSVWQYQDTPSHTKAFVRVPLLEKPGQTCPEKDPLCIL